MRIENNRPNPQPPDRRVARAPVPTPRRHRVRAVLAVSLAMLFGAAFADDDDAGNGGKLRRYIGNQVGGIEKLTVPAKDSDLPQPRLANGQPDPFFQTTEAKRYLGKQLFHDPARMVRIRPALGGVPATAGSASCGSCHLGETASKAGTLLNFAVGGEGRHYTDARGKFRCAPARPHRAASPIAHARRCSPAMHWSIRCPR